MGKLFRYLQQISENQDIPEPPLLPRNVCSGALSSVWYLQRASSSSSSHLLLKHFPREGAVMHDLEGPGEESALTWLADGLVGGTKHGWNQRRKKDS